MAELLKADEQSVLIVGKYYLVAHVHIKNDGLFNKFDADIPIIPIWHNDDKDFNFPYSHYHIDGRFVANKGCVAKEFKVIDGMTGHVVCEIFNAEISSIFYKRKKCLRTQTGVPFSFDFKLHKIFKQKYSGKSCKGKKCPHWGAKMSEINGELVCPMHGLKGDILTEKIK